MKMKLVLFGFVNLLIAGGLFWVMAPDVQAQAMRCDQFQSESIRFQGSALYTMYCQQLQGAGVGDPVILDSGFMDAVDIFGYVPGDITVCMRGEGGMIFRNKTTIPVTNEIPATTWYDGGYTCTFVNKEGILVLVANGGSRPAPEVIVEEDGTVVEVTPEPASNALQNCRVNTYLGIMNLRTDPTTSGDVISWIPFNTTLTAIGKTDGWYNVIYRDTNGWLAADFVSPTGEC